jgi:predicted dehydrogenase
MSAVCEKRVALIGAGRRGRVFAAALDDGELALRSVVDPRRSAARALAGTAGWARTFASVEALLEAGQVPDVAILCAPSALHGELAVPLLRGGADVLVEPPLATTRGDADGLTELAERLGRVLLCSSALAAGVRAAGLHRRLEALGPVRRVEIEIARARDARHGWRADPALAGGGVLMHLGPAALELAELLGGPLQQIRLLDADRLQRAEVEDAVRLETAHRSGALGSIQLTWNGSSDRPLARCTAQRGETVIEAPGAGCARALLLALLQRRRERDAICDEGARSLGWLHAAYRSRELGRWQPCS